MTKIIDLVFLIENWLVTWSGRHFVGLNVSIITVPEISKITANFDLRVSIYPHLSYLIQSQSSSRPLVLSWGVAKNTYSDLILSYLERFGSFDLIITSIASEKTHFLKIPTSFHGDIL